MENNKNTSKKIAMIALVASVAGLLTNIDRIVDLVDKFNIRNNPLESSVTVKYDRPSPIDYTLDITLNNLSGKTRVFEKLQVEVDTIQVVELKALLSNVLNEENEDLIDMQSQILFATGNSGAGGIVPSFIYDFETIDLKAQFNNLKLNQYIKEKSVDRFIVNIKEGQEPMNLIVLMLNVELCELNNKCHKIMKSKIVFSGDARLKSMAKFSTKGFIADSILQKIQTTAGEDRFIYSTLKDFEPKWEASHFKYVDFDKTDMNTSIKDKVDLNRNDFESMQMKEPTKEEIHEILMNNQ
tara:strand:+ start:6616 stop:7506 length:891 start_codon:yes stop_codon:yes gene_type:complete